MAGALSDPFALAYSGFEYPHANDPTGKTPHSPVFDPSERLWVAITAGQSLISNWNGTAYTATHDTKIDNLNIYDGGLYSFSGGGGYALGNDQGFQGYWPLQLADQLIERGIFDRVVLVPIAIGGSSIARWTRGGQLHHRLTVAHERLAEIGLEADAIIFQQGEIDGVNGTAQSVWETKFRDMVRSQQSLDNNTPWYVIESTYFGTVFPVIQAAQLAVIDNASVFFGANMDHYAGYAGNPYRQGGTGAHMTQAGCGRLAAMFRANVLDDVFTADRTDITAGSSRTAGEY